MLLFMGITSRIDIKVSSGESNIEISTIYDAHEVHFELIALFNHVFERDGNELNFRRVFIK